MIDGFLRREVQQHKQNEMLAVSIGYWGNLQASEKVGIVLDYLL